MFCIFFFNDTATTEIYTLSLHDALPIFLLNRGSDLADNCILESRCLESRLPIFHGFLHIGAPLLGDLDRKSTRLNSSHSQISYAVFCLKKKKIAKTSAHCLKSMR